MAKNDDVGHVQSKLDCVDGTYFDEKVGQCRNCTPCQGVHIVLFPCGGYHDNRCGPISDVLDFSFLDRDVKKDNEQTKVDKSVDSPEVIEANEEEHWKTLSFVLIGVISALVIVATVIVIISCHRLRNYHWLCKAVTSEQGI